MRRRIHRSSVVGIKVFSVQFGPAGLADDSNLQRVRELITDIFFQLRCSIRNVGAEVKPRVACADEAGKIRKTVFRNTDRGLIRQEQQFDLKTRLFAIKNAAKAKNLDGRVAELRSGALAALANDTIRDFFLLRYRVNAVGCKQRTQLHKSGLQLGRNPVTLNHACKLSCIEARIGKDDLAGHQRRDLAIIHHAERAFGETGMVGDLPVKFAAG